MSLKSLLTKIQEELKEKEEVRGKVQGNMRRVLRLSKQAILFVHQERFREAGNSLKAADELFAKLHVFSKDHPDLVYTGLVDAAFQEYAEAHTLLGVVKDEQFPPPGKLGVPSTSYVLGLADVVGEFRRRALDSLRRGNLRTAEGCLEMMEQIYLELTAMDDAYLLVPGLRRKCDIARRIIETTRGDVTIEARRSSLERSIKRLEKAIGGK